MKAWLAALLVTARSPRPAPPIAGPRPPRACRSRSALETDAGPDRRSRWTPPARPAPWRTSSATSSAGPTTAAASTAPCAPTTSRTTRCKIDVVQAGPTRRHGDGRSFPPIALERTSDTGLRHVDGAISMARDGPDTATSDFFICVGDQPELDFGGKRNPDGQGFAAFGRVVEGHGRGAADPHQPRRRPAAGAAGDDPQGASGPLSGLRTLSSAEPHPAGTVVQVSVGDAGGRERSSASAAVPDSRALERRTCGARQTMAAMVPHCVDD